MGRARKANRKKELRIAPVGMDVGRLRKIDFA